MAKVTITYTPDGGSERKWSLNPERPPWDVMYATEKATGWPWEEFAKRLSQSSGIAVQAILWALRKRDEPNLLLDSVRPADPTRSLLDDIDFEVDDEEPPAAETAASGEA